MTYKLQFAELLPYWDVLLQGLIFTIVLTLVSTVTGIAVGTAGASLRTFGPVWAGAIVTAYVELIRNTPFIVQLFFIFFGLPAAGFKLSAETASFIAMVVNLGAYAAEIIRAGIEATPQGQIEAAISLALNRVQTFVRVVLPPALKKVWPGMVSQIIIVMLGSSVCGQISTQELSYAADLIQSRNFRSFEAFIVIGVIYLLLSVALRHGLNWVAARFLFGSG